MAAVVGKGPLFLVFCGEEEEEGEGRRCLRPSFSLLALGNLDIAFLEPFVSGSPGRFLGGISTAVTCSLRRYWRLWVYFLRFYMKADLTAEGRFSRQSGHHHEPLAGLRLRSTEMGIIW